MFRCYPATRYRTPGTVEEDYMTYIMYQVYLEHIFYKISTHIYKELHVQGNFSHVLCLQALFYLLLVINCDCWSEILSLLELPELKLYFLEYLVLVFISNSSPFYFRTTFVHVFMFMLSFTTRQSCRKGKFNYDIWNVLIEWQQNRMQWQHPWMYRTCKAWSFTIN